jgi:hypothetical protein
MAPRDSGTTHPAFGPHDGLGLRNVVIYQHSLPGGSLRLTRTDLRPLGSRQLSWRTVW